MHDLVRQKCLDYIESEKEYYKDYIVGGAANFDLYIYRKRKEGIWGDDLEIQAMSEIYNRPIEIYAYSSTPMRTFHEVDSEEGENLQQDEPFRLSYHGKSHYNSIVWKKWTKEDVYIKEQPGVVEDEAISISKENKELEG